MTTDKLPNLETRRQLRDAERQQRQVLAVALNQAAKELRILEELKERKRR